MKIGLTGNIGSGKSTVCRLFESLGIPVFYSDIEAKLLYRRDDVRQIIRDKLGLVVFNKDEKIDFKKLASVIFTNKAALTFINGLVHPLLFERYNEWLKLYNQSPYSIHESAILFEYHLESRFDKTITVFCPKDIRINRVIKRDNVNETEVAKRIVNQMDDKTKNDLADYLIVNDGVKMLIPQVMEIHKALLATTQD